MYERPESYAGALVTAEGDERITPVGKWLRDTKINELPQHWNVLIGQMSLVGPRPEDPEIAATWPEETRKIILSVRPGITSPASILYRNEEKLLSSENVMDEYLANILPDKLRLDELYVKDQNFFTDLDVIFMTLVSLLPRIRSVSLPETFIFSGPLYRFARRTISWFFIDTVIAFLSISICGGIWRTVSPLNIGWGWSLGLAVLISLLFSLTSSMLGLKKIIWRYASPLYAIDLAFSVAVTTAVIWLINNVLMPTPVFPVRLIFDFGMVTFFGFLVARYRERLITGLASRWIRLRNQRTSVGERVLIVGSGECGELAIWLMNKSHYSNAFSIIGFADDDFRKQDYQINGYSVTAEVFHNMADAKRIAETTWQEILTLGQAPVTRMLDACARIQAAQPIVAQDGSDG